MLNSQVSRDVAVELSGCDQNPIQLIGAIQSHGCFIAFRYSDKTVYHASTNAPAMLAHRSSELVGKALDQVIPDEVLSQVLTLAERVNRGLTDFEVLRSRSIGTQSNLFEILVYEFEGLIALEFEPLLSEKLFDAFNMIDSQRRSRDFVEELHSAKDLASAARHVCRSVRSMAGFDRVMMYRYLPNWDGEVIAEDKAPEAHSFLHHRFPASDIPLPARELYLKNRTRQIVDSQGTAVSIEPNKHYLTRKPLDLTKSKLRAVSPVHLVYLQNMQVSASFSVAVIVDKALWGLIACHGSEKLNLPHEIRFACETLASTFGIVARMMHTLAAQTKQIRFTEKLRLLFQSLRTFEKPLDSLLQNHAEIEELFSAGGLALVSRDSTEIAGLSLPLEATRSLSVYLKNLFKAEGKTILALDKISALDEQFAQYSELVCGVLAIYTPDDNESVFMIFRREVLKTITWGGDPRKTMQKRNYEGNINPRLSFESWSETVTGRSLPWEKFEIDGATFLRDFVFEGLVRRERVIQELGDKLANRG